MFSQTKAPRIALTIPGGKREILMENRNGSDALSLQELRDLIAELTHTVTLMALQTHTDISRERAERLGEYFPFETFEHRFSHNRDRLTELDAIADKLAKMGVKA